MANWHGIAPIAHLIDRREPVPLLHLRIPDTTAGVASGWAEVLDGLQRAAARHGTRLLTFVVVADGGTTDVYGITTSRRWAVPDSGANAAAGALDSLVAEHGGAAVITKLREITAADVAPSTRRPTSLEAAVEIIGQELAA